MKKLIVVIAVLFSVGLYAQTDTTMTVLKPSLVLVEIVQDSTTTNDFLFKKKEVNDELQRINQTILELRARKAYLLEIKSKMD
jgi:hypothetical protein